MNKYLILITALFALSGATICTAQVDPKWEIHDRNRPNPTVITAGTASTQDAPGKPPSDAVVLFDGKDLSHWAQKDGSAAKWKVENGYFEVVPKTGELHTKEAFGDCQLHVEFREPDPPKGEDQDRGNSGVFLMGLYEIQVLDSYQSKTYCGRPGRGCLRPVSSAGQCVAPAGAMANLRHHLARPALRR